jgi:hypothetical protein
MINYINGDTVGYMQVFPQNPVSESIGNFIIGRAPWDYAFLFYGDLDEIRVWNVQRSQEEIKENMFKHLNGDETGLVAYYNFNQPNGATFYDQSPNNNNGTINEFGHIAFEWANSYAPVGDELMNEMHNIQAAWCGKKQTAGFNLIDTLDGLSFITDIREKEFHKYLVAGHDNLSGTTQDSIPLEAPLDFKRLKRTWYVNQGGSFTTNLVFDLKKSAAYNDTLEAYHADSLYTLLKLNANGRYEPVYSANIAYFTPENYNLVFENVNLSDGFYTVGYGSERLAPSSSINEISAQKSEINIYPNPAREQLTIEHSEGGIFEIFDLSGKKQFEVNITSNSNTINIASLPNGIYIVKIKTKNETFTNKIIIQ